MRLSLWRLVTQVGEVSFSPACRPELSGYKPCVELVEQCEAALGARPSASSWRLCRYRAEVQLRPLTVGQ
jgi:hypothetical protein